jgi:hypothetical protein
MSQKSIAALKVLKDKIRTTSIVAHSKPITWY